MSYDLKLGNDFLRVPRLSTDGKGFVTWKDRLELSIRARGLYGHLDGSTVKPNDPPTRPEGSTLTEEEVSSNEAYMKNLSRHLQEQAIVFQQIASTIPDSLYLKIKGKPTVKEAWDALKNDFQKRSKMITIELQKRLQDTRCTETGNIRTHFDNIRTMREELASLGTTLSDPDFVATILGSLPKSYDQFLSAITATASVLKKELEPEDLIQAIIDEYDRRSTRPGALKDKSPDAAFFAGGAGNNRGGRRSNKDVECFNCHKKGHRKADCWAKGGGKEGQGPRSKDRKGKAGDSREGNKEVKDSANAAGDDDGVWMALVDDSGDERMDTEFDDFEVFEDLFEDDLGCDEHEDMNDGGINIAADFEKLTISDVSKRIAYPYDNPNNLFDIKEEDTDSSDDESTAVAMQVMSDSENEVDIDPYWSKVTVDELQGLGNPLEVHEPDTDSMPDLESVPDSINSRNSMSSLLTVPNSDCLFCGIHGHEKSTCEKNADWLSDEEMEVLVEDKGEDGYTTFDAAMLVNVEGSVEGIQTELYDSGASRHMSPYRDHFENYIPIVPKSITAADKRYFQAIGKGNLRIKIPNGSRTTTVLLKDVLHCPDMGLTLVSIGKITSAGCKMMFRGPTCRIFDQKDKIIGQIDAKNGLYRVDHDVTVNVAMAGEAREALTIEEFHRRMGHIAPEAAKRMVSSEAVEGVKIDSSSTIQSCDSCEYAKATRKPIRKT